MLLRVDPEVLPRDPVRELVVVVSECLICIR
jgi:hypothetical protein